MENLYLRKCVVCDSNKNKSIDIREDNFIRESNKCYHIDCFIHKENLKKRNKLSESELFNKIEVLKMETYKWKNEIKYKNELMDWIYNNYNTTALPSWIMIKISDINNGNFKGLKEGIPFEDILAIFKKMKNYLDKTAFEKKSKGTGFKNASDRISYDLSVVVNNYDKYRKWKDNIEKTHIENTAIEKKIQDKKIYENVSINKKNKKEEINVAEMIDEFF